MLVVPCSKYNDISFRALHFLIELVVEKKMAHAGLVLSMSDDDIRRAFSSLKTVQQLSTLLEVRYDRLVYHLYKTSVQNRYAVFQIPKKSGGYRYISSPITPLKIIQQKLNHVFQCVYKPKPSVHGFTRGKSIVSNALVHSNRQYLLNLDLQDFFPSINFGRVRGMFMAFPYNLPDDVATVLAQICCHNNQLPQGAPTSPVVSNMLCAKMDSQLQQLAKAHRTTYTRYADDISFSTTLHRFPPQIGRLSDDGASVILGDELVAVIHGNNFRINESKVWYRTPRYRMEVTGLTTNQFPNVRRKYVRQIRAMLHAWQRFGIESASAEFNSKYYSKHRNPNLTLAVNPERFKRTIRGKIAFVGMVRGKEDEVYNKLLLKYSELSSVNNRLNR